MSLAGLRITALPAASAGPTLWHTRLSGKLNGVIAATTPHGTRSVKPSLPAPPGAPSSGSTSPREPLGFFGRQFDRFAGPRDFEQPLGQDLAFFGADQPAELVGPLAHQIGGLAEDLGRARSR